jgi:hypothetical protein
MRKIVRTTLMLGELQCLTIPRYQDRRNDNARVRKVENGRRAPHLIRGKERLLLPVRNTFLTPLSKILGYGQKKRKGLRILALISKDFRRCGGGKTVAVEIMRCPKVRH